MREKERLVRDVVVAHRIRDEANEQIARLEADLRDYHARNEQLYRERGEAMAERDESRDVARRIWREIIHGTDCRALLKISGNVVGVDETRYPWIKGKE